MPAANKPDHCEGCIYFKDETPMRCCLHEGTIKKAVTRCQIQNMKFVMKKKD